eukprot:jgi/Mesvir1/16576/Mv10112-RA.1
MSVTIKIGCDGRNNVAPVPDPDVRKIMDDEFDRMREYVSFAVPEEHVEDMMMYVQDMVCRALTGMDLISFFLANGATPDQDVHDAIERAKTVKEGEGLRRGLAEAVKKLAAFVEPPQLPAPNKSVKNNKRVMKDDSLLTRPLTRSWAKRINT